MNKINIHYNWIILIRSILFIVLFGISSNVLAQLPSSYELIKSMKNKTIKADGYDNIYFDYEKGSLIIAAKKWDEITQEEYTGFTDSVAQGSFTKAFVKEYLLIVKWNSPENYGFSHVENWGPLSQFVIFDSSFNQVSKVYFKDATTILKDIQDIDSDGINEIFIDGSYGNQGFFQTWTGIYYKDLTEPVLHYISEMNASGVIGGEHEEANTSYETGKGIFTINVNKVTKLFLSEVDVRIVNEITCKREYSYRKGKFNLISGKECDLEGY